MPVGKRRPFAKNKKVVTEEGFEPSPPKRLVPETSALDRSAIQPMPKQTDPTWPEMTGNDRNGPKMAENGHFRGHLWPFQRGSFGGQIGRKRGGSATKKNSPCVIPRPGLEPGSHG